MALLLGCGAGSDRLTSDTPTSSAVQAGGVPAGGQVAVEDYTPSGKPGLDYAPDILLVGYRPGATLPAAYAAESSRLVQSALARPNPVLRRNPGFGAITSAIADCYRMQVHTEAYVGGCNFAAFDLPAGANGEAILADLRVRFADVLVGAGYCPLGRAAFVPDDPDFVLSTPTEGGQWGQRRIGCEYAWDLTRGDPDVLIGVVDTGVTLNHEDLAGQVLDPEIAFPGQQLDLANDDNTMEDDDGHGTAVAGMVAATTDNATAVASVAHGCRIIPVKIANDRFFASYADMAAGCLLAAQLGARVVNMSWYGENAAGVLKVAVDQLAADGVLLVISAGNLGSDVPAYPGAYENCLSVGATTDHDSRTAFSNYGSDVDVAAPGEDLKVLTNTGAYKEWWGTSFSAPLVAGGAALLWSYAPELTLESVRSLLERTGPPTTGFQLASDVRRLDLALALGSVVGIEAPSPDRLIQRDQIVLAPELNGDVLSVELYADEQLAGELSAPPWAFQLDLSAYSFELVELEFRAIGEAATASDFLTILVDNTLPVYELAEGFDGLEYGAQPLDVRDYSPQLLGSLRQMPTAQWTAEDVAANGPGRWALASDGFDGTVGMRVRATAEEYGAFETDVLITRGIDLAASADAQLSFQTRYNIEQSAKDHDRGWVLVTTDLGETFTVLEQEGEPLSCGGFLAAYEQQLVDLGSWLGEQFHLVFLFESDADGSGEQPGEPAGWWVDEIELSGTVVLLGGLEVECASYPGAVTGTSTITAVPTAPLLADRVEYWLDFAPFGELDAGDIALDSESAPYAAQIDLTAFLGLPNQHGILRATPIGAGDFAGPTVTADVFLFNQLGDVNGDGAVDLADSEAYPAMLGLDAGHESFVPFFDSDLDGTITEADAGAVGYFYGDS